MYILPVNITFCARKRQVRCDPSFRFLHITSRVTRALVSAF